jgi:signal transduction histidine kinase
MSWVTVIFSMTASACLTLSLIYVFIWWRQKDAWANLLFALAALGTAAAAWFDLALLRAQSPTQMGSVIQWSHVATWLIILTLAGFVRLYLRAGRLWLLWTVCGLRTIALSLNFLTGQNLNYLQISSISHIPFLGETVSTIGAGVVNPSMIVGQLGLWGFVVFAVDAAITVWRRGDRRMSAIVGGSIVFFLLAGTVQTALIVWGHHEWPPTSSLFYLGIIAAMGYEFGSEALRATQLARELRASEQKAAEERAAHRNELAHLLRVASLGELSTALAHELKQPLAAILANAQAAQLFLAHDEPDLMEVREILGDIVADDNRANEVIDRLRALFKKGEFLPRPLHDNELIEDVLKLMHQDLVSRGVRVIRQIAADLPPIRGDRVQLEQVLINLILNAGDAMSQAARGARALTLGSCLVEDNIVEISVEDTGTGIPPGSEEQIFEPYHSTKPHGLGLGLSLSRAIVLAHGGRLWVENKASGGAIFCFTVPAWKDDTR